MQKVGFWRFELPAGMDAEDREILGWTPAEIARVTDLSLPVARECVDLQWSATYPHKAALLAYLRDPARIIPGTKCHSAHACRMCPCLAGQSDMGDGTYLWPEGFAHYVDAHGVRPPADFLEHVEKFAGLR